MTYRKAISIIAVLVFGVAVAVPFFPRTACDINELAYETVCDVIPASNVLSPDILLNTGNVCDRGDKDTASFRSVVAYFLEKHENSPPA